MEYFLFQGIAPVLPIFREGILNGAQDVKEAAALGLREVIALTSSEALKPSVVNITGPLIRILGDRFMWNVKVAVLETLTLLLSKVSGGNRTWRPSALSGGGAILCSGLSVEKSVRWCLCLLFVV